MPVLRLLAALALAAPPALSPVALPLPGSPGLVAMDYLAVDDASGQVWVPAGNTGQVDVVDAVTGSTRAVTGFATGGRGAGPSAASVAPGVVYVGSRATGEVCAVDARRLKKAACVSLAHAPDGVAHVASTREVWVTTPSDGSLTILDVATPLAPRPKAVLKVGGQPEGYAVDEAGGRFFTNLEDADATLVYDVRTKKLLARYAPGCGQVGPRGLAYDARRGFLFVACTDGVAVLGRDGAVAGRLATGGGVDNIDYRPEGRRLYVASGRTATLTVAVVDDAGRPTVVATAPTAPGARVVVADARGTAFVADSAGGRLLVVKVPGPDGGE